MEDFVTVRTCIPIWWWTQTSYV